MHIFDNPVYTMLYKWNFNWLFYFFICNLIQILSGLTPSLMSELTPLTNLSRVSDIWVINCVQL